MAEYRTDQYRAAFRATLHPDYEGISDEQADALFTNVVAGMSPPEADAYVEGLGSFFNQVVSTAARTAPTWAPILGAAAGSVIAPGAGTAVGAGLGGAAGNIAAKLAADPKASAGSLAGAGVQGAVASRTGAGGGGQPLSTAGLASTAMGLAGSLLGGGAAATPPPAAPAPRVPPTQPAAPAAPAAAAPSRPAANQLMSLLNNPHLDRAVLGQANGAIGRSSVPVRAGGRSHQIPFGAFLNALIQLAQLAAIEATDAEASAASYLTDSEGAYAYDPTSPEQRADALLALLDAEYEERSAWRAEPAEAHAAPDPTYDQLTEWFLSSGLIR